MADKHGGIALLHFIVDFDKEDKEDGGEDDVEEEDDGDEDDLTTATLDLRV